MTGAETVPKAGEARHLDARQARARIRSVPTFVAASGWWQTCQLCGALVDPRKRDQVKSDREWHIEWHRALARVLEAVDEQLERNRVR